MSNDEAYTDTGTEESLDKLNRLIARRSG